MEVVRSTNFRVTLRRTKSQTRSDHLCSITTRRPQIVHPLLPPDVTADLLALSVSVVQQNDYILCLPSELKMLCFGRLTAVRDIHALSATSRSWRQTFLRNEAKILRRFAQNMLRSDLPSLRLVNQAIQAPLVDYTTQIPSTKLSGAEFKTFTEMETIYRGRRAAREAEYRAKVIQFAADFATSTVQLRLSDSLSLQQIQDTIKTHQVMQYLVDDFVSAALARHLATGDVLPTNNTPLSQVERHRLFTAFYR